MRSAAAPGGTIGWPGIMLFVAILLSILASIFCFYQAYRVSESSGSRIQSIMARQVLAERLLNRAGDSRTSADLADMTTRYDALQQADSHSSDTLGLAWQSFRDVLPGVSIDAGLGNSALLDSDDFDALLAHTRSLSDGLELENASAQLIQTADHLTQLASTVSERMRAETPQLARARGPWLVFEQLLGRLELQLGTNNLPNADLEALVVDIRSLFGELDKDFRQSLEQLNQQDARAVATTRRNAFDMLQVELINQLTLDKIGQQQQGIWFRYGVLALVITSLLLVTMALLFVRRSRLRQLAASRQDEQDQASILRLLDEISALADGDLNTKATVTEDMTGAIADSVNYAVGELRRLVGEITHSADRVSAAVEETGASATQLATAGTVQSREIHRSANYLKAMADTMEQISSRSGEASSIASESVELSLEGARAVRESRDSVDRVNQQLQSCTSLINQLSASSDRIGDILKLVESVSSKTRLLALNTAIQAAGQGQNGIDSAQDMGGVADSMQALAGRLTDSANEITGLLAAIQHDAAAVLQAVDQTGREVERSGQLAGEAGTALEHIESASRRLSVVVEHLSRRTRRQSDVVQQLSANMGVINEVTRKSARGMQLTATALDDLRLLASDLRNSVADFILPSTGKTQVSKSAVTARPRLRQRLDRTVDDPHSLSMMDDLDKTTVVSPQVSPTLPSQVGRNDHD